MFLIVFVAVLFASTTAFAQEVEPKRPALLIPLYVSNAVLNGADVHSTVTALRAGHVEANPLMKGLSPAQMIGVKAATVATGILLTEKLWKHHRKAAVTVMIISNAAVGVIAARNYRIAAR